MYQFSSIVIVILFELMAVLRPMIVPTPNAMAPVLLLTVNVLEHIYSRGRFAVETALMASVESPSWQIASPWVPIAS
jgi:hypothetical protein